MPEEENEVCVVKGDKCKDWKEEEDTFPWVAECELQSCYFFPDVCPTV